MKRRILPILLALVMLLSLMPTVALADGESTQQTSSVASYTNNSQVTKYYNTVGAAISASNSGGGGTITLLQDTSFSENLNLANQITLTIDLGKHTLTSTSEGGITIGYNGKETKGCNLTIKNGTYKNTHVAGTAIWGFADGSITIEEDAIIEAVDTCICTGGNYDTSGRTVINVYGKLTCGGTAVWCQGPYNEINIYGAEIEADEYAVFHTYKYGGSKISIKDSKLTGDEYAVYLGNTIDSSYGKHELTVENSELNSNEFGICVEHSDVDIKGEKTLIDVPDGYALAVIHNNSNLEGTTGTLDIEGGTLNGQIAELDPSTGAENEAVLTVSGGKFDTNVDGEFIAENLKYGAFDGQYYSYHATREAALAAAGPNGYVFAITGPGRVTHTVTVVYNNGTEDDTWTVIDNETIAAPAVPTKSGYTFICWDDGAVHYLPNDNVTITKDTTLTAKWIGNDEYSLSLDPASLNLLDVGSDTITVSADVPGGYKLVMTNSNGSVADAVMSEDGKTITVTAKNAGSTTISVSIVSDDGIVTLETKTCNVVVGPSYAITIVYGNGTGNKTEYIAQGDDYRLPAAPSKPGYIFMGWKCSDEHTHQAGEVIEVTKNMTFTAIWANMPDITPGTPGGDDEPVVPDFPFTDVREGQWFYEAVKYVYSEGIMNGMDRYTFAPNGSLTRAMVWTMLARLDGVDTEGGATWYSKAQDWAMSLDISDGTNPMGEITRQELVTMLWRYAYVCDADMTLGDDTNILSYIDIDKVSDWAVEAFQWCCGAGIIEGDENGALNPTAGCTRAEAAAMFMRLCKNVDLSPTV